MATYFSLVNKTVNLVHESEEKKEPTLKDEHLILMHFIRRFYFLII